MVGLKVLNVYKIMFKNTSLFQFHLTSRFWIVDDIGLAEKIVDTEIKAKNCLELRRKTRRLNDELDDCAQGYYM